MPLPGLAEAVDDSIQRQNDLEKRKLMAKLYVLLEDLASFANGTWSCDGTNDSFPEAYNFGSWRFANMYCTWASIRLLTQLEIQRLLLSNTNAHGEQRTDIDEDIENTVENICTAIPSHIGSKPHSLGMICSMSMLSLNAALLERAGKHEEARWCASMLEELHRKGIR